MIAGIEARPTCPHLSTAAIKITWITEILRSLGQLIHRPLLDILGPSTAHRTAPMREVLEALKDVVQMEPLPDCTLGPNPT